MKNCPHPLFVFLFMTMTLSFTQLRAELNIEVQKSALPQGSSESQFVQKFRSRFLSPIITNLPQEVHTQIFRSHPDFKIVIKKLAAIPSGSTINQNFCRPLAEYYKLDRPFKASRPLRDQFKFGSYKNNTLTINSRLVAKAMGTPREGATNYNCEHKTFSRSLQGLIVNAIGQKYLSLRGIPKSQYFKGLAHFKERTNKAPWNKSTSPYRLPDHGFLSTARSAWSKYFEYYVLLENFNCRYPAKFRYFSEIFPSKAQTAVVNSCDDYKYVFSKSSNKSYKLDINHVGGLDYIFVAKSKAMASRWGHAMLRINICRNKNDPEEIAKRCADQGNDIVLTVGGRVPSFEINTWSGLNGTYPVNYTIEDFFTPKLRYDSQEGRNLETYPLLLSDENIEKILEIILENSWTYRGQYKFLTANCSTEIYEMLKTLFSWDYHPREDIVHPLGLKKLLASEGLIPATSTGTPVPSRIYESKQRTLLSRSLENLEKYAPSSMAQFFSKFKFKSGEHSTKMNDIEIPNYEESLEQQKIDYFLYSTTPKERLNFYFYDLLSDDHSYKFQAKKAIISGAYALESSAVQSIEKTLQKRVDDHNEKELFSAVDDLSHRFLIHQYHDYESVSGVPKLNQNMTSNTPSQFSNQTRNLTSQQVRSSDPQLEILRDEVNSLVRTLSDQLVLLNNSKENH